MPHRTGGVPTVLHTWGTSIAVAMLALGASWILTMPLASWTTGEPKVRSLFIGETAIKTKIQVETFTQQDVCGSVFELRASSCEIWNAADECCPSPRCRFGVR